MVRVIKNKKGQLGWLVLFIIIVASVFIYYMVTIGTSTKGEITIDDLINTDSNVSDTQFLKNLRFSSNRITYLFIDETCRGNRQSAILQAMTIISNQTNIDFVQQTTSDPAMIDITCDQDKLESPQLGSREVLGEAGPVYIWGNGQYNVIDKSVLKLYADNDCQVPISAIHELLHALGFDHTNDEDSSLYPELHCSQQIDKPVIDTINELYSIPSLPDLLFLNMTAEKNGGLFSMDTEIGNYGLVDINSEIKLVIKEDNNPEPSHEVDLQPLKVNARYKVEVDNLRVKKRTNNITIDILFPGNELNKTNNKVTLNYGSD